MPQAASDLGTSPQIVDRLRAEYQTHLPMPGDAAAGGLRGDGLLLVDAAGTGRRPCGDRGGDRKSRPRRSAADAQDLDTREGGSADQLAGAFRARTPVI
jgi:hypothetical protein